MAKIPPSAPASMPALSNRLADLAERAGEAAQRYRRGSVESIREYLVAGDVLAIAKGECKGKAPGTWGAVLARAGIEPRTARRMMQAYRITCELGADAEAVHDAGGVQAFVAKALHAADVAVEAAGAALDAGEDETVFKSVSSLPAMPVESADGDSDGDSGREPAGVPPEGVSGVLGGAEGRTGARAARVEAGLCRCGRDVAPGRRQCEVCLTRDRARTRSRLAGGRYAAALDRRLREAAEAGRGLALSPADVERLVKVDRGTS